MAGEVVIVDSGLICATGNQAESWHNLMANHSSLTPLELSNLHCHVGRIVDLPDEIGSRQRLVSLIRRGINQLQITTGTESSHLIVATTKGAADEPLTDHTKPNSGFAWQVAEMIAREINYPGQRSTVSAACASGTVAIIQASQMIEKGEVDQVLVVGIDILSRFVLAGFSQLQALAEGTCRPFDKKRNGLCLGEGIGLLLLTSKKRAAERNWPALATINGWGIACDASHITAPCRQASGLSTVLHQATAGATKTVGAINAHGTGTIYNDAMEITAFKNLWGNTPPPFHSVKGAMGHCLGAAGVIEACLAVTSLHEGKIPATVGLHEPENFPNQVGDRNQDLTAASILSCNSGFGGINAAILLNS
ncbi:MAG: beta-ketoacyl synthase N-terminal-like domain-containing protein [Thermodesulfobacteriota bacterium]